MVALDNQVAVDTAVEDSQAEGILVVVDSLVGDNTRVGSDRSRAGVDSTALDLDRMGADESLVAV